MIVERIPHIPDAAFSAVERGTQTISESPFNFLPIEHQDVDPSLCFLPSHLRTRLTLALYKGWRATFTLIRSFLRHTLFHDAPTVSNLREYLKTQLKTLRTNVDAQVNAGSRFTTGCLVGADELKSVSFYLSNGGLLEFSIDYVFQLSSMSTYTLNTTHPSLIPLRLHDRVLNAIRLLALTLSIEDSVSYLDDENSESFGLGRQLRKCALDGELEMTRGRCCPEYTKDMLKWGPHEIGVEERAMFRLERFSDDSRGNVAENGQSGEGSEQKEGRKKNGGGKYAKRFALTIGQD